VTQILQTASRIEIEIADAVFIKLARFKSIVSGGVGLAHGPMLPAEARRSFTSG